MNTNLKVRDATAQDIFSAVLIKNIAWNCAYKGIMSDAFLFSRTCASAMKSTIEKWENSIRGADDSKVFLVAEDGNGEIIGFAFGGDIGNQRLKTDKDLHAIYVHPAAHGTGAGKALMLEFARRMKAQGAKTLGVGCLSANKSMGFYKRMGGKFLFEMNNPHFENILETFLEYNIEELLSI